MEQNILYMELQRKRIFKYNVMGIDLISIKKNMNS